MSEAENKIHNEDPDDFDYTQLNIKNENDEETVKNILKDVKRIVKDMKSEAKTESGKRQ